MSQALLSTAPLEAQAAGRRAATVERMLGDPADRANPAGHRRLLAADRAATVCEGAEDVLDSFGMNAEFVPRALGGRFDSCESLLRVMRPVWRRDVGLGMGYGMTTFMAASDVWMRGTPDQQRRLARLLLTGSKAAMAQHETAHTNDFVRSQVRLAAGDRELRITGAKPVINNLQRADALVLFGRGAPDGDGLSTVLLDPRGLPADRFRITRRPPADSVGLRGYFWAGARFTDCPVPREALLGPPGGGVVTAERSFQLSRTLMAALVLAAVDSSLRTAVLVERTRAPGAAADPQNTATTLTKAFVNLLLYDSLAVVATRALHLLPTETSVYSAAIKSLLPKVLRDTTYDLATVLGSQLYARDGTVGVFQKIVRDVPIISLGHAGTVACQTTIIPQLTTLARTSWFKSEEAPAALFRPAEPLPPFSYGALATAGGRDSLSASLLATAASLPGGSVGERTLRALAQRFVAELRDLRGRVLALQPPGAPGARTTAWFALTDRYVLVLAAAAVLGVWRASDGLRDPFLADPAWAACALHRIAERLGIRDVDLPPQLAARVHQEVLARFGDGHGFDLYNTPLPH
ncbi:acyl-CoA dehydrogenase [Streptomyces beihaiensis]|uniref:Acyl-CoA dehydrogenase n=1 Tax=Streptomyces beihaiensis TaxID=2984495 RepID=A0ABT3TWF5_9ACTN|nr:acyl-CoA dehydrogenase [Streptomyces beihaiensis]MCX3061385.1 acyl-CoA dehydrogenase [Streptomyces beihaiensis]